MVWVVSLNNWRYNFQHTFSQDIVDEYLTKTNKYEIKYTYIS